MKLLISKVKHLKSGPLKKRVNARLKEFISFRDKTDMEWFSELCFCLLTANSKAKTALSIQEELGGEGFASKRSKTISNCIRKNKHRFHNNKTKFIINARTHLDIKNRIRSLIKEKDEFYARQWLVDNIKGLGYKEASHFLRNTGHFSLAILDRHVLRLMREHEFIAEIPKSLNKKNYLLIEEKLKVLADLVNMSQAELDLYLWYMKTGELLK